MAGTTQLQAGGGAAGPIASAVSKHRMTREWGQAIKHQVVPHPNSSCDVPPPKVLQPSLTVPPAGD